MEVDGDDGEGNDNTNSSGRLIAVRGISKVLNYDPHKKSPRFLCGSSERRFHQKRQSGSERDGREETHKDRNIELHSTRRVLVEWLERDLLKGRCSRWPWPPDGLPRCCKYKCYRSAALLAIRREQPWRSRSRASSESPRETRHANP